LFRSRYRITVDFTVASRIIKQLQHSRSGTALVLLRRKRDVTCAPPATASSSKHAIHRQR